MATTPTTPPKKTTPTKTPITNIPTFAQWSEGRTGFSKGELAEIYASIYGLTPEAIKKLKGEIGTKATTTLIPKVTAKPTVPPQIITRPAPDLLITRTPYPKWWKDLRVSGITIVGSGVQAVTHSGSGYKTYVASITLIVDGPTSISFGFGEVGASGPMPLGDEGQPMGITISMSDSPAPCGKASFSVHSINAPGETVTVGGFVVYYSEED
jgi:hypothetical protein